MKTILCMVVLLIAGLAGSRLAAGTMTATSGNLQLEINDMGGGDGTNGWSAIQDIASTPTVVMEGGYFSIWDRSNAALYSGGTYGNEWTVVTPIAAGPDIGQYKTTVCTFELASVGITVEQTTLSDELDAASGGSGYVVISYKITNNSSALTLDDLRAAVWVNLNANGTPTDSVAFSIPAVSNSPTITHSDATGELVGIRMVSGTWSHAAMYPGFPFTESDEIAEIAQALPTGGGASGDIVSAFVSPTETISNSGDSFYFAVAICVGADVASIVAASDGAQTSWDNDIEPALNPLVVTTADPLPEGTEGQVYSGVTMSGSGGSGLFSWSAAGLPGGLDMDAAGAISGTPDLGTAAASPYTVTVTITDGFGGGSADQDYTLVINASTGGGTLTISPSTLQAGTELVAYPNTQFTATGGTGTVTWSATGLPTGLSMSTGGLLSGTPAASTSGSSPYTVDVSATDGTNTGSDSYSLVINAAGTLTITTGATLPSATEAEAYSAVTLAATGGTPAYTWTITTGALPAGMTLAAGVISGTPAVGTAGTCNFTITVTDNVAATQQLAMTLVVLPENVITRARRAASAGGFCALVAGESGDHAWLILVAGLTLLALPSVIRRTRRLH